MLSKTLASSEVPSRLTPPVSEEGISLHAAGASNDNKISLHHPNSEAEATAALSASFALDTHHHKAAQALGNTLAQAMQQGARDTLALRLLAAFPLTSAEGLALMRITEALLRVPDTASAAQLLCDELASAPWRSHSNDAIAKLAAFALRCARGVLRDGGGEPRGLFAKPAVSIARMAVHGFGEQFVFAQTVQEALRKADERSAYSFDMLGEQALNAADVARFTAAYQVAINSLGPLRAQGRNVQVSIKLSALHARYTPLQHARVMSELVPRVDALIQHARVFDLPVCIDAEEARRLELSLDVFAELSARCKGWDGLGLAVQAYQLRAPQVIARVIELARRDERRIQVRLVKGAYWDSEIKHAQAEGLTSYPVFTRKENTDLSYLACAAQMMKARAEIAPAFATHNAHSFAAIIQMAEQWGVADDYEFQCLHGMGEPLIKAAGAQQALHVPMRIYAPVGAFDALLPYLVRRLLENGANTSFLAGLNKGTVHNATASRSLPLPRDLFPGRVNSEGVDWGAQADANAFLQGQKSGANTNILSSVNNNLRIYFNKNNDYTTNSISSALENSSAEIAACLQAAHAAAPAWAARSAQARGALVKAWGDALQAAMPQLAKLMVQEAGKTLPNAVADVREAVDFCRYYAQLALDAKGVPLGVVATIAPWNFPLAIFTGQSAAALAAGNAVIAKPAEQTPLIAIEVVRIAHEVGIPKEALQLALGDGKVGAQLVADKRVNGVMFTGSLAVAKHIERTLHLRSGDQEIPFVAETSGLNAMIVDSTALIDQAVQDVVASAFDSAGQRCSALRLLWLQEDMAERFIEALKGAMAELSIGSPDALASDIGPVIDEEALARLAHQQARLEREAKLIARVTLPKSLQGYFFAPCAYEIANLEPVREETFGPILHIKRFKASEIGQVVNNTAALGYALTFGLHTRLASRIEWLSNAAPAGNVYINRNIIGAVVGSQPFGGSKKSGTGPKAGGPWALLRLQRGGVMNRLDHSLQTLPGITGERNTRQIEPRGIVACAGPSEADVQEQMALLKRLGLQGMNALKEPQVLKRSDVGAVLRAQWSGQYSADIAAIREDIFPQAIKNSTGYELEKLYEERVVSNNIAAAGGDVSLLTS